MDIVGVGEVGKKLLEVLESGCGAQLMPRHIGRVGIAAVERKPKNFGYWRKQNLMLAIFTQDGKDWGLPVEVPQNWLNY